MGDTHPKASFFFDVSAFFARIGYAANIFESLTLKIHGGAILGTPYYTFVA